MKPEAMNETFNERYNSTLVKQLLDGLLIQPLAYTAEGVSDLVIRPAYIVDLEVVSSHCCHPPMSDGIQIGHLHEVSQWIVVGVDEERLVLQILPKLFSHGPLESQELQLRGVIFQLASLEAATGVGDGMGNGHHLVFGRAPLPILLLRRLSQAGRAS